MTGQEFFQTLTRITAGMPTVRPGYSLKAGSQPDSIWRTPNSDPSTAADDTSVRKTRLVITGDHLQKIMPLPQGDQDGQDNGLDQSFDSARHGICLPNLAAYTNKMQHHPQRERPRLPLVGGDRVYLRGHGAPTITIEPKPRSKARKSGGDDDDQHQNNKNKNKNKNNTPASACSDAVYMGTNVKFNSNFREGRPAAEGLPALDVCAITDTRKSPQSSISSRGGITIGRVVSSDSVHMPTAAQAKPPPGQKDRVRAHPDSTEDDWRNFIRRELLRDARHQLLGPSKQKTSDARPQANARKRRSNPKGPGRQRAQAQAPDGVGPRIGVV